MFSCFNRFSRWPEAVLLHNITASLVVTAFLVTWYYGMASRSRLFKSHLWRDLLSALGPVHRQLQANGFIVNSRTQRLNKTLSSPPRTCSTVCPCASQETFFPASNKTINSSNFMTWLHFHMARLSFPPHRIRSSPTFVNSNLCLILTFGCALTIKLRLCGRAIRRSTSRASTF